MTRMCAVIYVGILIFVGLGVSCDKWGVFYSFCALYSLQSAKANPEPSEQTPKRTQSPEGHSDEVDPELQWR